MSLHCIESERCILGACLADPVDMDHCAGIITAEDFYDSAHDVIWRTMLSLYNQGTPLETSKLLLYLRESGNLKEAGGAEYLTSIASLSAGIDIDWYVTFLLQRSHARQLEVFFVQQIKELREGKAAAEVTDHCVASLPSVGPKVDDTEMATLSRALTAYTDKQDYLAVVKTRKDNPEEAYLSVGLPSGIPPLDEMATILRPGSLVVVGARPAMGKTAFALQLTRNLLHQDYGVSFITLEMSRPQLVHRLMCLEARVDSQRAEKGCTDFEYERLVHAEKTLGAAPLLLNDGRGVYISHIVSLIRQARRRQEVSCIVIDYFQLMRTHSRTENRNLELGEISGRLKQLALEMKIPVVLLAQLNRKSEERTHKRPFMSDLRDCGQLEQDADVVAFLHRQAYYDPHSHPNQCEFILAKNRHGPVGTVKLHFTPQWGAFGALAPV